PDNTGSDTGLANKRVNCSSPNRLVAVDTESSSQSKGCDRQRPHWSAHPRSSKPSHLTAPTGVLFPPGYHSRPVPRLKRVGQGASVTPCPSMARPCSSLAPVAVSAWRSPNGPHKTAPTSP